MEFKKYVLGYSAGYIVAMLMIYFIFDWFSLSFALSSLMGIVLFAFILKRLMKKDN